MSVQNVNNCIDKISNLQKEVSQGEAPLVKIHTVASGILCEYCKKEILERKWCGGCKKVYYCNSVCQTSAWPSHKTECIKTKAVESVKSVDKTLSIEDEKVWKSVFNSLKFNSRVFCKEYDSIKFYKLPKPKDELDFVLFWDYFTEFSLLLINQIKMPIFDLGALNPVIYTLPIRIPSDSFIIAAEESANVIKKQLVERGFKNVDKVCMKFVGFIKNYLKKIKTPMVVLNGKTKLGVNKALHDLKNEIDGIVYENSKELGYVNSVKPFVVSEEQLKKFGISKDEKIAISCYEYVFFSLGEINAKEFIYNSETCRDILSILKVCHYTPVDMPRKGDIVLYCRDTNNPSHLAQCTENGKVISKIGLYPYIVEHDLKDVPISYGEYVSFFRKDKV